MNNVAEPTFYCYSELMVQTIIAAFSGKLYLRMPEHKKAQVFPAAAQ